MIYIIIGIILLVLLIIYFYYEDFKVKQTNYEIKTNKIDKDYKIIQISDFHNERNKWLHKQIIETIKNEKPDIIVITGDLIDKRSNKYADILLDKIDNLSKIYYVPGNHEFEHGGYLDLVNVLNKHNVTILDNKNINIENNICLYGIKDPMFEEKEDELNTINMYLDNFTLDKEKYNILLSHRPEHFDSYINKEYDLVFSGHAHGGQVILPVIGPLFSPHQGVFPKYAKGIHKKNNTNMIVSRGLGNSLFAVIRINNRPEIIKVSLLKK